MPKEEVFYYNNIQHAIIKLFCNQNSECEAKTNMNLSPIRTEHKQQLIFTTSPVEEENETKKIKHNSSFEVFFQTWPTLDY